MNEERHERKAYWLVIVRPQFLTGGDTKGLCPSITWIDREGGRSFWNKVQVYRSVRMPQLHTSLHFHLTPIVMINGSSRRDLLLNSQNFCRSIPAGAENPSLSRLCYRRLWGSRNRRALILGWAYYLDAFSSYPLRTWLPSVYRGHNNWYTRGVSPHTWSYDFAETCVFGKQSPGPGHCDPLCEEAPLLPKLRGYFAEFLRESCLAPLGALAGDPGCFPLDDEAYPPSSHWPTLTPVILRSYLVFRVCLDLFERLTYSGISGSTLIFNSPKHFVAYYALPRLWVPRVLWSVRDPWMPKASLGRSRSSYGVETMGSVHGFSFLFPHFAKGLKEDSASSCSQGPT
ncbi:hypothetical protein POTOM_062040 (chloroplast) [Populus tomentosa]|uniref:Uncharacterized protein n=1 Tax=Populus tomentosa TaxID=118781 RepID=A0A8X8C0P9_POPTO|nr:hypothetical protein POTOM_062040 [Populus tomentosa]